MLILFGRHVFSLLLLNLRPIVFMLTKYFLNTSYDNRENKGPNTETLGSGNY